MAGFLCLIIVIGTVLWHSLTAQVQAVDSPEHQGLHFRAKGFQSGKSMQVEMVTVQWSDKCRSEVKSTRNYLAIKKGLGFGFMGYVFGLMEL